MNYVTGGGSAVPLYAVDYHKKYNDLKNDLDSKIERIRAYKEAAHIDMRHATTYSESRLYEGVIDAYLRGIAILEQVE